MIEPVGTISCMVEGFTAPGFEPVTEAFARNFSEFGEVGAAFSAYRRGERVLDLWSGRLPPSDEDQPVDME